MLSHSIFLGSNRSELQFIGDLTDLYKRHKVSCGDPRDLEHLDADLVFNENFRTDLFTLCSAIGHMAEVEPSPEQLLTLVARAFGGPSISTADGAVDVPDAAGSAFLDSYQRWCKREPESAPLPRPNRDAAAASVQQRTSRYYVDSRSELEIEKSFEDPPALPASPTSQNAPARRSIPANTPLESLTLNELRLYLEDIESRVTRIEPLLEQAVSRVKRSAVYFEQLDQTDVRSVAEEKVAAGPVAEEVWETAVGEPRIGPVFEPTIEPVIEPTIEPVIEQAFEPLMAQAAEPVVSKAEELELQTAPASVLIEPAEFIIPVLETFPNLALASTALAIPASETMVAQPAVKAALIPTTNDPRLSRLRIINAVLAVLLIVAAGAAGVFAYRYLTLPRTSATIAEAIKSVPATLKAVLPSATKPVNTERVAAVASATSSSAQTLPNASSADAKALNKPATPDLTSLYKNARQAELPLSDTHLDEKLDEQAHPAAPTFSRALAAAATPAPSPTSVRSAAPAPVTAAVANPADTHVPPPATRSVASGPVMVAVPASVMMSYAIETPKPLYPAFRNIGVDSVVEVVTTISKDGKVLSARSTDGTLDVRAAAVRAVQSWRFRPYALEGSPVAVSTTFRFVFKGR